MLDRSSPEQCRCITGLLEDPSTLLELVENRNGTFVAQACLSHLAPHPASLLAMVIAVQGKTGQLGCTQEGTFFLQRLVEVLGQSKGVAFLLQEDILTNIDLLATNEVGFNLKYLFYLQFVGWLKVITVRFEVVSHELGGSSG